MKKVWFFFWPFALGTIIGVGGLWLWGQSQNIGTKFLSPLGLNPQILATKIPSQKPVIGFLPYWNLSTAQIPYHLLDYLAYFSVGFNADGSILTQTDQGDGMGWYRLSSNQVQNIFTSARQNDVGLMLVFTSFNNEVIDTIITNPDAKQRAINNIVELAEKYEADAINVDFEYNSNYETLPNSSAKYAQFLKDLKAELIKINPDIKLSIDLYANAFIRSNPYEITMLAPVVDHLVLMGYDFHQAGSPKAGPIAPVKSKTGKSISQALEAAIDKGVPTQKIILAMPFYGYEWQTTTEEHKAPTYPGSGAMASYKRVHQLIEDEDLEVKWDFEALSPWLTYEPNGITSQIYFENDESIALKLQLINQVDLAGAAIWALGYEGQDASVWPVIETWRRKQN